MRKIFKHLSLLLVALMSLSLTACGNKGNTPGNTKVSADLMKPFTKYSEPVTLTFARITNAGNTIPAGMTTSSNPQINFIKQKLNIDCKIAWETSPDQYNNRLALAIAGQNLPDVFIIQSDNYLTFRALVQSGQLADLTDTYKDCIGGLAAQALKSYSGKQLASATFNNKIMGIPCPPTGYNYNVLWVRNDWLKKVNMPAPKTIDDIKNVALAFQKAKLGGSNTMGIVTDPVTVLGHSDSFLSLSSIANAEGAYPQSWITGPDGKVVYGSITPEMKTTLGVLADWYKAGVLDPQFMTYQNMDAVTPALHNGQCGMYFGAYWSPWTVAADIAKDPSIDWIPVLAPLDANGKFNHINSADATSFVVVSKKCAHPEAVVKANNLEYDLMNGAYDQSDPDVIAALKPAKDNGASGRTISPFSGAWLANSFDSEVRVGNAMADYCKTGTLNIPADASPAQKSNVDVCYKWYQAKDSKDTTGYSMYNSYATEVLVGDPNINKDEPVAFSYTTPSMGDYWPALFTLEKQTIVQIISGQKPLSYFDDFVSQWKKDGGDTITAEVQQMVSNQK